MPNASLDFSRAPDADRATPLHLQQLVAWCRAHPEARKVVFTPNEQLASAVQDALHQRGAGGAGLDGTTAQRYAAHLAQGTLDAYTHAFLPDVGATFVLDDVLSTLDDDVTQALAVGDSVQHLAPATARAVRTLRSNGVSPEALADLAGADDASPGRIALAKGLTAYEAFLAKHRFRDETDLYRWARGLLEAGPVEAVTETVFAIYDDVTLSEEAARFVAACRAHGAAFARIGLPEAPLPPPATSAAARFADAAVPPVDGVDDAPRGPAGLNPDALTFRRAVGSDNEVRSVFQDILDAGVPFDQVEIAHPEGERYRSLLAATAQAMDVPVSLSTGVATPSTRPGQALVSFYDWVLEDFAVEPLIRMLRGGLLRLDRLDPRHLGASDNGRRDWERRQKNRLLGEGDATRRIFPDKVELSDCAPALAPHRAATLLASRRYETGRSNGDPGGYTKAFRNWVIDLDKEIAKYKDARDDDPTFTAEPTHLHEKRAEVLRLWALVEMLRGLLSKDTITLSELATASIRFLNVFGPVEASAESARDEEESRDEAGLKVVKDRMNQIKETGLPDRVDARRALRVFKQSVENSFVQGLRPLPGRIHVVPIASAGYTGRSHLYVVGMDADSMSTSVTEDALLLDEERDRLAEAMDVTLPRMQDAADEEAWAAVQALWRHTGPTTFVTRVYDVENAEELYPSSLFLRLEQTAARMQSQNGGMLNTDRVGFRPETGRMRLDERASWLGVTPTPDSGSELTAVEAWKEVYPGWAQGWTADAARASDAYTTYDGLLAPGTYPDLDLLSVRHPVSATRLETLAGAPYVYFLRYVLGVKPLDEPALDDVAWLDALTRGTVLHDTFQQFMEAVNRRDEVPSASHEDELLQHLKTRLEEEEKRLEPPSKHVRAAALASLLEDARVFLQAEIAHAAEGYRAEAFEYGFGMPPHRQQEGDAVGTDFTLRLGDLSIPFRGRIDRVDRRADGTVALWDYKTGSRRPYDPEDPVQEGETLQWALYAYAYAQLRDEPVQESGYFFTSKREMGARMPFDPSAVRHEVTERIRDLAALARAGSFPMRPSLHQSRVWKYAGLDRLLPDPRGRSKSLRDKSYPEDRPGAWLV